MKKAKQILIKLPEYYFIVIAILAGYTPPFSFNPIFVGLAFILILQIVFKNKISGILLGSAFLLMNLYMLGALFSEFIEFTEFNNKAKQLLFVGLSLWIWNMLLSVTMIYKYSKNDINPQKVNNQQKSYINKSETHKSVFKFP